MSCMLGHLLFHCVYIFVAGKNFDGVSIYDKFYFVVRWCLNVRGV